MTENFSLIGEPMPIWRRRKTVLFVNGEEKETIRAWTERSLNRKSAVAVCEAKRDRVYDQLHDLGGILRDATQQEQRIIRVLISNAHLLADTRATIYSTKVKIDDRYAKLDQLEAELER